MMNSGSPQPPFAFQEFIVRPYIRLVRTIGISMCFVFFMLAITVLGFRGKRHHSIAPVPVTLVQHRFAIPLIWTIAGTSLVSIFLLLRLRDVLKDQKFQLQKNRIVLTVKGDESIIVLNRTDEVSFGVMPLFHKLFNNRFHRIGCLIVIRKDRRYAFYFPVRNDGIAEDLIQFTKQY